MGATQKQFEVGGMSCSFCAERTEKAYSRIDGVDVSLAQEEVVVCYDDEALTAVELKDALREFG